MVSIKNEIDINDAGDNDGIKHSFPHKFKFHGRVWLPSTCATRALVVIGDPIHTIASTTRRFEMDHINKLRNGAGLPNMSLKSFKCLFEAEQLNASAIIRFQYAWLSVKAPYVKVVTTKDLYGNLSKWKHWLKKGGFENTSAKSI